MTPQDELRAAASLLHETAAKATSGPWYVSRVPGIGRCVSDSVNGPVISFCVAVEPGWVSDADAEWIALMSPDKAELLAVLLEAEAARFDSDQGPVPFEVPCDCWETDPSHAAALATARAIRTPDANRGAK